MKTLDDVERIEDLEKVVVTNDSEILTTIEIDGKIIIENLGIDKNSLMKLLRSMRYGIIGWENYNVVEERSPLEELEDF